MAMLVVLSAPRLALAGGDVEYGEYLAQQCLACHQLHEAPAGIPSIGGLPADYFAEAMDEYKLAIRENITMRNIALSLGDEEIEALAAYYELQVASD